uniref:Uncharacterized protein n=1 Tax=Echinococcus granulosus TaxID=6210 RepID=A0A068WWR7_ECHGR|nr:hypothetical protein EgrG_000395800 [Echinococcus granulosus]
MNHQLANLEVKTFKIILNFFKNEKYSFTIMR